MAQAHVRSSADPLEECRCAPPKLPGGAHNRPIETCEQKSRMPCFVQAGAPQTAGERLGDDLFNLEEKQKPQAPRPTRSLQKAQGALRRCSAAGHSARAYVTGCKATIRECHGKQKPHAMFRAGRRSPNCRGAPRRRPFQSGGKTKASWITDCADRRGQTKSRLAAPRQLSEKRIHSKRQESRGLGKVVLALLRPRSNSI